MKNVLITGGGGFIGANLVRRLVHENVNIHVLIKKGSIPWRLKDVLKKITLHEGVVQPQNLERLLTKIKPADIYHLATYGSYPFQKDERRMVNTNIVFTMNLLRALRTVPYKNLIVAGSSSEYGKKKKPMKESDILEPNNMYAAMKASQTYITQAFAREYKKPAIILRLFSVYGFFEEEGRLVRSLIESVLHNQQIRLATGKEARDFIFVEDVVDALIHAANSSTYYGEVFNIGTGKQTTIQQLAQLLCKLTGKKVQIELNAYPGRKWDTQHWVADTAKTRNVLGWQAKTNLEEGLKKTLAWYKEIL